MAEPKKSAPSAPAGAAGKTAKQNFDAAQALFDRKKYDAALALFRRVYDETKSPNARIMIGQSLLLLGRTAEAYDELAATMREAAAMAETAKKYERTRDAAASELAKLETRVGKLVITFVRGAEGARVSVNGAAVPADKLGKPMAVMPGDVRIVVEGLGASPSARTEPIKAGETKTIVLGKETPSTAPAATASITASAAPSSAPVVATGGGVRTAGFVVAGLGVAGMALFGVGAALAQSKFDQLEKECGGVRCKDASYADVVDAGKMFDMLSTIGLGAGIAGITGGALMILLGGPKAAPAQTAAVELGPHGATLRIRGSF
jgi:hypothetical protein